MKYAYNAGVIIPYVKKYKKQHILAVAGLFMATIGLMSLSAAAAPVTIADCDFDEDGAGNLTLLDNCTSSEQINLESDTTLNGNGFTITAGFAETGTDNTNNAVLGVIGASNVTVENLTIDGSGGTSLHLINTYESTGVVVQEVNLLNANNSGIVVNRSDVTVSNVLTSGSGWHGINVDKGTAKQSILTVAGPVDQSAELFDIFVDDYTNVNNIVNDELEQYTTNQNEVSRLYTWADVVAPEVEITAPASASMVSGDVEVTGVITDYDNVRYRLLVRNSDNDVVFSKIVNDNSDVVNALVSFDSTQYPDGNYRLVLVGIDGAGNRGRDAVNVVFDNFVKDKADCKNGGWEAGVFGSSFRNQGDCVSYFATNGNNPPANEAGNERANSERRSR